MVLKEIYPDSHFNTCHPDADKKRRKPGYFCPLFCVLANPLLPKKWHLNRTILARSSLSFLDDGDYRAK